MKTITLAHYYTSPEVQGLADFVGDSLYLAEKAKEANADRIVFAGVRFMAETAKILNPEAQVILPNSGSTCSLVEQTDIKALDEWDLKFRHTSEKLVKHVMYINSSARMKSIADVIVTSRNVEEVCQHYIDKDYKVIFSPDRNMGAYLKYIHPDWDIEYWSAVCEVHDKFKEKEVNYALKIWTDGPKYLLAHPESPLPVLKRADLVGSTSKMLSFVENLDSKIATVFVATEEGLLHNMREARPDLDIRQLGNYQGCQCNVCPYMKLNTTQNVLAAKLGFGEEIKLTEFEMGMAYEPIKKMMEFT